MSGDQFIALFSQLLGETESLVRDVLKARFDSGDRSPEFVQEYLDAAIVDQSIGADFDFQRFAELKKIAGDYFASRDHSVLINETDARLIATYWDKTERGDQLVEFVIDNYDEFVSVSSDAAMSQFVLGATWYAGLAAAELGDGSYRDLFSRISDEEPLSKAVAYDLARDPDSCARSRSNAQRVPDDRPCRERELGRRWRVNGSVALRSPGRYDGRANVHMTAAASRSRCAQRR